METTPFGPRLDIVEFCADNGIIVMCDNPLAKDLNSDSHQALLDICERLDMTPQQVRMRMI
jgi:diketogulonate reductase-like aldo/keto reductase